jgi:hypothetical protein
MPKVQTLTEWSDVLRLSTKWGFGAIRSMAIETILPLASPVDKIAISRAYDIDAWIDDAFVDILARESDLTLAEAQRIPLEDVVAIAQGRRMARTTASVKPRAELRKITAEITRRYLDPVQPAVAVESPPGLNAQSKTASEPVDGSFTPDTAALRKIKRWLDTYTSMSEKADRDTVVLCISTFLKEQPSYTVSFLELALLKGRPFFDKSPWSTGSFRYSNSSYDGWIAELFLAILSRDRTMNMLPLLTTVYLRVVNQWVGIISNTVHDQPVGRLSMDETTAWVKYFQYLTVCGLGGDIFKAFWVHMRKSLEELMDLYLYDASLAIVGVLAKMGAYTFWPDAIMEMDDFYDLLDRAREECKDKDSQLASYLQVVSSFVQPPLVISLTCFLCDVGDH